MKRHVYLTRVCSALIMLLVVGGIFVQFARPADAQSTLSRVWVDGSMIRSDSGPFFLLGANVRGAAYNPLTDGRYDDWWTWRNLDAENIKAYGFNVIRLEVYWDKLEVSSSPGVYTYDSDYVNKMMDTVQAYNARGIYVYINLEHYSGVALNKFLPMASLTTTDDFALSFFTDTSPNSGREHLKRVWLMLSGAFKDQMGIIGYGILNEPHLLHGGDNNTECQAAADAWFDMADYVIAALRQNGDNHIAFVNLAPWASSAQFMRRTLRDTNVVYEPHFYQGIDQSTWQVVNNDLAWLSNQFTNELQITMKMNQFNVPFIIGEFGFCAHNVTTGDSREVWIRNSMSVFREAPTMRGMLYYCYVAYGGTVDGTGWQTILWHRTRISLA